MCSPALVFTSDARGIFMGGSGGGFFLQASRRKRSAMLAMRAVSLETALCKRISCTRRFALAAAWVQCACRGRCFPQTLRRVAAI